MLESSIIIPRKTDDDADDGFIFKEELNKNFIQENVDEIDEIDDDEIKPLSPEPIINNFIISKKNDDIKKINIDDI